MIHERASFTLVGNKNDSLNDEQEEQPFRQKLEVSDLPGECLHSG